MTKTLRDRAEKDGKIGGFHSEHPSVVLTSLATLARQKILSPRVVAIRGQKARGGRGVVRGVARIYIGT